MVIHFLNNHPRKCSLTCWWISYLFCLYECIISFFTSFTVSLEGIERPYSLIIPPRTTMVNGVMEPSPMLSKVPKSNSNLSMPSGILKRLPSLPRLQATNNNTGLTKKIHCFKWNSSGWLNSFLIDTNIFILVHISVDPCASGIVTSCTYSSSPSCIYIMSLASYTN